MSNSIIYVDELYHHGILGQKWGQRQGPPYPLEPSDHSASEKKAGWSKSLNDGHKNVKKANDKIVESKNKHAVEISNARKTNLKNAGYKTMASIYGLNEKTYNKLGNKTLASMNKASKEEYLNKINKDALTRKEIRKKEIQFKKEDETLRKELVKNELSYLDIAGETARNATLAAGSAAAAVGLGSIGQEFVSAAFAGMAIGHLEVAAADAAVIGEKFLLNKNIIKTSKKNISEVQSLKKNENKSVSNDYKSKLTDKTKNYQDEKIYTDSFLNYIKKTENFGPKGIKDIDDPEYLQLSIMEYQAEHGKSAYKDGFKIND